MAFFGLTAYGPQSAFQGARPELFNVTLFDIEGWSVKPAPALPPRAADSQRGLDMIVLTRTARLAEISMSNICAEFASAFDQVDPQHGAGVLSLDQVEDALRIVFRGEIPPAERSRVMEFFEQLNFGQTIASAGGISRDRFLDALVQLQQIEAETPIDLSKSAHYSSFDFLKQHKLKQVRPETGPADIYAKPLTALSDIGWSQAKGAQPIGQVRYPKKHCEETKFMGELFKAGLI